MPPLLRRHLVLILLAASGLRAQTTLPSAIQALPAQSFAPGASAVTLDLRNYFSIPGVIGQVVQFDTVLGRFNVELLPSAAPQHVANFLNYIQAGAYPNSFFHRSASFDGGAVSIVQGGGYRWSGAGASEIPKFPPVALEYNLPNARGTLAAARTSNINSATSEWYFNVRDNTTILGTANNGGYSVFGRVLGSGMTVVDAIAALPRVNAGGAYTELPVRNYAPGANVGLANLALVSFIATIAIQPGSGAAVLQYSVENSAPNVVSASINGSTLVLTPLSGGAASITVRATDTNGNVAENSFVASVTNTVPVFTVQPSPQRVASGNTVVFRVQAEGGATYQWLRNDLNIPGANSATLVIPGATAANAGSYKVVVANSVGPATSTAVNLVVDNVSPVEIGRLVNLSILTPLIAGETLTMGTVLGGQDTVGTKPLLARAAGPALSALGVVGVLPDPTMMLTDTRAGVTVTTNDNWGGSAELRNAFTQVAAFGFGPDTSADAAIFRPNLAASSYTVQVRDTGAGTGSVIAELYDATPESAITATTPRLVNVSVLKEFASGGSLTVGFYVGGATSKTLLIRAIGPALGVTPFNISTAMADPRLTLFNGAQAIIATNDDWGGGTQISDAAARVAAFRIDNPASKDAILLITLAPGLYTVRADAIGGGGHAIVEVYEIP